MERAKRDFTNGADCVFAVDRTAWEATPTDVVRKDIGLFDRGAGVEPVLDGELLFGVVDLPQVRKAGGFAGRFSGAHPLGNRDRQQDSKDQNNNENFNQRKAASLPRHRQGHPTGSLPYVWPF